MKREYSIFEAKAHLSEIIRIAKNSHEIIITNRKIPVVKVVPLLNENTDNLAKRVDSLVKSGLLSKRERKIYKPNQIRMKKNILKQFLDERE